MMQKIFSRPVVIPYIINTCERNLRIEKFLSI